MNYIWDIIIKARQLGIDETKIKFIAAKSYSPYMELSNENINFKDIEQEVELNPYYRFLKFLNTFSAWIILRISSLGKHYSILQSIF